METRAYVWALDSKRQVLVTDDPGPPVGGRFIGSYPLLEGGGWGEAAKVAQQVSAHDKYPEVIFDAPLTGPEPESFDDEDKEGAEEWMDDEETPDD